MLFQPGKRQAVVFQELVIRLHEDVKNHIRGHAILIIPSEQLHKALPLYGLPALFCLEIHIITVGSHILIPVI